MKFVTLVTGEAYFMLQVQLIEYHRDIRKTLLYVTGTKR